MSWLDTLDAIEAPGWGATRSQWEVTQKRGWIPPAPNMPNPRAASPRSSRWSTALSPIPKLSAPVARSPVAPPERFAVELPTGAPKPLTIGQPPDPGNYLGLVGPGAVLDFGGITNAVGNTANSALGSGLDIGTAIPWAMQNTENLLHALGDQFLSDSEARDRLTAMKAAGGEQAKAALEIERKRDVFAFPVEALSEGLTKINDVLGPALDGPINWYTDSTLGDRSKVYAALASGRPMTDSFGGALMSGDIFQALPAVGSFLTGTAGTRVGAGLPASGDTIEGAWRNAGAGARAREWNTLVRVVKGSGGYLDRAGLSSTGILDPAIWKGLDAHGRLSEDDVRRILGDAIDLPDSVKSAIEADPDIAERGLQGGVGEVTPLGRAFTAAGGRDLSYRPENALRDAVFRLAVESASVIGLGVGARGLLGGLGEGLAGAETPLARGALAATRGAQAATSSAAKIQRAMFLLGLGSTGVTAVAQGVARVAGDDQAIRFLDNVWRTHPLSDDPNNVLVTSFAVNPLEGLGALRKGTLRLAGKAGGIAFDKATAGRFTKLYTSDELILERAGQMMAGLRGNKAITWARANLLEGETPRFANVGELADLVVGQAADILVDPRAHRLPAEVLAGLQAGFDDPVERTRAVFERYGKRVMDIVEKEPEALRERFREHNWNYHQYAGSFDPGIALDNFADYRQAQKLTYQLRSRVRGAVLGYVEFLPREETDRLRADFTQAYPDPTAQVPVSELNDLIRQRPALRGTYQDLPAVRSSGRIVSVPRSTIDEMLDRADVKFAAASRDNPVLARTGASPFLRPAASDRDWADALGASPDVFREIRDGPDNVASPELRRWLSDKGYNTELETPEQVHAQAVDLVAKMSEPWVRLGRQLDTAEKAYTAAQDRLETAVRIGDTGTADLAAAESKRLAAAIADIREPAPNLPFVSRVAEHGPVATEEVEGPSQSVIERARRRAAAMTYFEELDRITEEFEQVGGPEASAATILDSMGIRADTKEWTWHGGFGVMPADIRKRLEAIVAKSGKKLGNYDPEGPTDWEWWGWLKAHPNERGFLSKAQRRIVDQRIRGRGKRGVGLEDLGTAPYGDQTISGSEKFGYASGSADLYHHVVDLRQRYLDLVNSKQRLSYVNTLRAKATDEVVKLADAMLSDHFEGSEPFGLWLDPDYYVRLHPERLDAAKSAFALRDGTSLYQAIGDDPVLQWRLGQAEERLGMSIDRALTEQPDRLYSILFPPERSLAEGEGVLDNAIRHGDDAKIASTIDREAAIAPAAPMPGVTRETADALARQTNLPPSTQLVRRLQEAGGSLRVAPSATILANSPEGAAVLSVIRHGVVGTKPPTLEFVLAELRAIERGDATAAGIGLKLQAEAQRTAVSLLTDGIDAAKRAEFPPGVIMYVDPARLADEDYATVKALMGRRVIGWDATDPLGLTYGIKEAPRGAVVLDLANAPAGLAEELARGKYEPYAVRSGVHQVRQAYNLVFGRRSNSELAREAKAEFGRRLEAQGIDPQVAGKVWSAWAESARESRSVKVAWVNGRLHTVLGDNPLYADLRNLPDAMMNRIAVQAIEGEGAETIRGDLGKVDWSRTFRESTSLTRRTLADRGGPLGRAMAQAYGGIVHNRFATTTYYWFRFGLDPRFHMMNLAEGGILYGGRAALRPGTLNDRTWLGMTRAYLSRGDQLSDLTYPFTRGRFDWAYKAFVKEQAPHLVGALDRMEHGDPRLFEQALKEMAAADPELSNTIRSFGDTPEGWLRALDEWHGRLLTSADPEAEIREAFAAQKARDPALGEIIDRLSAENESLWSDIRATFYGNPDRSRAERVLNSWLLFWPLSYQIKAGKWLLRTLYGGAGGLPVNALGAVEYQRLSDAWADQLKTDPGLQDFVAQNDYALFVASMMLPTTTSTGVTLNPLLRDIAFGRAKNPLNIGPVYTVTTVLPSAVGELYRDLADVPEFHDLAALAVRVSGRRPPKEPEPELEPPPPLGSAGR